MTLPLYQRIVDQLKTHHQSASDSATVYIEAALDALESPRRPGTGGPTDLPDLDAAAIAALIDHTQLKPDATLAAIAQVCEEALTYDFASVCIHPTYVSDVAEALTDSSTVACTVIGFPLGANCAATKAHEAQTAVKHGAREVDMVLPIGRLKSGQFEAVEADIRAVVDAAAAAAKSENASVQVKVIIETALLTGPEKALACICAKRAGADFVKTSTGFAATGAVPEDVALMRQMVGKDLGVKASGGVGSASDVAAMVAHGASRIGASGSVGIMESLDVEAA